jgi:hypothetical protein
MYRRLLVVVALAIMTAFAAANVSAQDIHAGGTGKVRVECAPGTPCNLTQQPVAPRTKVVRGGTTRGYTSPPQKEGDNYYDNRSYSYQVVDDSGGYAEVTARLDEIIKQQKLGRDENRAGFEGVVKEGAIIDHDMNDGFAALGRKLDIGNGIASEQLRVEKGILKQQKIQTGVGFGNLAVNTLAWLFPRQRNIFTTVFVPPQNNRRPYPFPTPTPVPPTYGPCRVPNGPGGTMISGPCPPAFNNTYNNTVDPLAAQARPGYDPWTQASPLVTNNGNALATTDSSGFWNTGGLFGGSSGTNYSNTNYNTSGTYNNGGWTTGSNNPCSQYSSQQLQDMRRQAQAAGTRLGC